VWPDGLVLRAVGAISAAGEGAPALFDAALACVPLGRPVQRYDVQKIRTPIAALIPPELLARTLARWPGLDPSVALALAVIDQATGGRPLPPRTALLVGTSLGCTASWEPWHRALTLSSPSGSGEFSAPPGAAHGDVAWQVAKILGLRGPFSTVSTACTSSPAALIQAADMIHLGEVDDALVVGVDVLGTFVHAGFDALRALSPADRPPTPFGLGRAGLWLGEGAACVWLSREGQGRARLLAGATAGDAFHMTAPEPGGRGMTLAIERALSAASLAPGEVCWVSAHGTGTAYNDAMEARALHRVFAEKMLPVHGLKPVIGHTLGACGVLEVALIVEALGRGLRPPTYQPCPLDPELAPLPLDARAEVLEPGPVLSINAAFAGHNTALVLAPLR